MVENLKIKEKLIKLKKKIYNVRLHYILHYTFYTLHLRSLVGF